MLGGPVMFGGQLGNGSNGNTNNRNMPNGDGVFVSIASYDPAFPLLPLFTLMEAFGGVVSMRRGVQKPNVVTVKVASVADADNCCRMIRRCALGSGDISCKPFPAYVNKNPPTEEGNPSDAAVVAYDFTKCRHRAPNQRSTFPAGPEIIIAGCASKSESDVMTYFSEKSFYPENVVKNADEGTFVVKFDTMATAIKALCECQFNLCGNEKANITFAESIKTSNQTSNGAATTGDAADVEM
eukprot:GILI01004531.1.p1 GENE.GILI01004531.1~~GILI01004531.1.p1  ORF type:complete len:280 (-),score=78.87 GILI01004531.1:664-1383(-)